MTYLVVHLDDGTEVIIYPDGQCSVDLRAMRAARHDLHGHVMFDAAGRVVRNAAEDAYVHVPLKSHVLRAVANAAGKKARFARRAALQVLQRKGTVRRYEPDTLEYMALRALGKIREDGWPCGYIPL